MSSFTPLTYALLAVLAVENLLSFVETYLNLSALTEKLPAEFGDVFDAEDYAKSQRYTRAKSQHATITSIFNTLLFVTVWLTGTFNTLDVFIRASVANEVARGVLYVFVLGFAGFLAGIPFSLYFTFVLEERFGFNRTDLKTFVVDRVKSIGLAILFGGPLMAAVFGFFLYYPDSAWFYCWLAFTLFTLFFTFITPKYILPLFYTLERLEKDKYPELHSAIYGMCDRLDFKFSGVYIMDGSKRSSHSNAFFAGFGPTKRIVLFDSLVEKHSADELVAVLGHEVGHYKKKHVFWMLAFSLVQMAVMFYVLQFFISSDLLAKAFLLENVSVYTGFVFFSNLYSPVETLLSIVNMKMSRLNEFEADRFAVDYIDGGDKNLVAALKKLCKENLANLTPHPFHVFMSYTHPPILQRIGAIRDYAQVAEKKAA